MTILSRSYRWSTNTVNSTVGGSLISGQTSPFYTTVTGDIGKYLFMEEKPVNEAGGATWFPSNVIGPIVAAGVTYVAQAGTIAPLTSAIGGRIPTSYESVYDNENLFFDAARNDHMLLHKTLCDDIEANFPALFTKTVKAGIWSDPTVWSNGVPAAGMFACLDHDNILDLTQTPALETITVHGKWTWDSTADRTVVCDTILLMPGAIMERGTRNSPVPESTTQGRGRFEIWWKPGATNPGATAARGLMSAGEIRTYGAVKPQYLTCTADPMTGDRVIHVGSGLSLWRIGDDVDVESQSQNTGSTPTDTTYTGPTSHYLLGGFNESQSGGPEDQAWQFKNHQNERRKITDINVAAGTLTINAPLTYDHPTRTPTLNFIDGRLASTRAIKPVVSNLSRSIRQLGKGDLTVLQQRAHPMYMQCARIDIRYEQYFDMGRTSTDPTLTSTNSSIITSDSGHTTPINNPNNVRGRYAGPHIHGIGRNNNRPAAILKGVTVGNSIGAPVCPGWGIVAHNSRVFMHDCTVDGVRGAGFVSEVGTEVGQWINCRALHVPGDGFPAGTGRRSANVENHNGSSGVGFELQSRAILMQGCVAKGCHAHTVSLLQDLGGIGLVRAPDVQAMRLFNPLVMGGTADVEDPYWNVDKYAKNQAQPIDWNDNLALDCDYGFFVADRHRTYRNDLTPMIAKRFTTYGVPSPVFIENYSWHYYFYDIVCFGVSAAGSVINMGAKAAHMHIARGIVEGFVAIYGRANGDFNAYSNAIDLATDATDLTYCIASSSISGAANPPTFVIDNPSPPSVGGAAIVLSAVGGKDLTLDWFEQRIHGDPTHRGGAVQFDGVMTDGAGPFPWPFIQSEDANVFYAYSSATPEVLVRTSGCFNASGTWKTRFWFVTANRFPPLDTAARGGLGDVYPHIVHPVDATLTNFPAGFLAANTIQPNDGQPVVPFLPEDPDKPHAAAQVPSQIAQPFIIGPLVDSNTSARVNFGAWSEYPAEVDDHDISWKADGIEFATTRIASLAGKGGKTITCDGFANNTAGRTAWTALYSGVCATAAPSIATTLGSALKEYWQLDTIPKYVKPAFSGGAGLDQYADNCLVAGDWYAEHWFGAVNKLELQQGGDARPKYQKFGNNGRPALYFKGKPDSGQEGDYMTCFGSTGLTGITNPHVWIVFERDNSDLVQPGAVFNLTSYFYVYLPNVSTDSAQNKVNTSVGGLSVSTLPKGSRAVIYAGMPTGAIKLSVNNGTMQSSATSVPTETAPWLQIGGSGSLGYPQLNARGRILHVTVANSSTAMTTQQLADMQTYLAQRYL